MPFSLIFQMPMLLLGIYRSWGEHHLLFLGHTLHLDKPLRTAYGCMHYCARDVGIYLRHHARDSVVVGEITQIDDEILDVVHSGATVGKQCSDVLKQSASLLLYVAKIHHLSLVVDTCSAGYII